MLANDNGLREREQTLLIASSLADSKINFAKQKMILVCARVIKNIFSDAPPPPKNNSIML